MKLTCLLCNAFFDTDDYDTPQVTYLLCLPCRERAVADAKAEAINAKPTKRKVSKRKPNPKIRELQKALKARGIKLSAKGIKKAFPSISDTQKKQVSAIRRKARQ